VYARTVIIGFMGCLSIFEVRSSFYEDIFNHKGPEEHKGKGVNVLVFFVSFVNFVVKGLGCPGARPRWVRFASVLLVLVLTFVVCGDW
jgi:hypothetical protein